MYMGVLGDMCDCAPRVYLVPMEARRGQQIPQTRVTADCEPPCGSGTWNKVLWQSSQWAQAPVISPATVGLYFLSEFYCTTQ